ncbi:hypothetical protein ORI89_02800 [Sphingobacterium sp. UT-1RO-CII-1]|uniref:hypothetical protein n=1 Tax=Sphingobacterium sp. UT-1RO-CII-1 TaxID=2995225 RepID=UPI00227B40B0|nr:hypothetical protein [Sphingobacterium sp. UT-1RO-CII-1]MCY4778564.1 hypothetical protein [Sphingobacterium sp. UT-1RO-CII-1]
MSEEKHRGEFLSKIVTRMGSNVGKLMERMGYHRTTYYTHIKQADLDYSILAQYTNAIPYDFTLEFPELKNYLFEKQNNTQSITEIQLDRDKWRTKYYDLLEKYNDLLEKRG